MNLTFKADWLEQLANDEPCKARISREVAVRYREKVQLLIDARDERDLRANRGLNFEAMKSLPGTYSVRVTRQYRILFEIHAPATGQTGNTLHITDLNNHYGD